MVVSCTIKVLVVYSAVCHLYHACACDTWWVNSPCKAYTLISPPLVCTTQGQTQGANKQHSLLGYTLIANQTTQYTCHYTATINLE